MCGGSHSLDACKTASSTEVHVLDKESDLEYCGNSPDSGSLYIDLFISDRDLRRCRLEYPIFVLWICIPLMLVKLCPQQHMSVDGPSSLPELISLIISFSPSPFGSSWEHFSSFCDVVIRLWCRRPRSMNCNRT